MLSSLIVVVLVVVPLRPVLQSTLTTPNTVAAPDLSLYISASDISPWCCAASDTQGTCPSHLVSHGLQQGDLAECRHFLEAVDGDDMARLACHITASRAVKCGVRVVFLCVQSTILWGCMGVVRKDV